MNTIKKILILCFSISFIGCTTITDKRLIGTWISDKEKTMGLLQKGCEKLPEKREKLFNKILGEMKVTYSENKTIIELDGEIIEDDYEVIGTDHDSVAIKVDGIFGDKEIYIITFEDDYYYVFSELGGFVEYFKKIEE